MRNNKIKYLTGLISAILLSGCNGVGSSEQSGGNQPYTPSSSEVKVPLASQIGTPVSIYAKNSAAQNTKSSLHVSSLSSDSSCLVLLNSNGKNYDSSYDSSEWWSTAKVSFTIKNTCNSPVALKDTKVAVNGFAINGKAVASFGDVAQSGSGPYMAVKSSGNQVIINTPECNGDWCSWAQLGANGEKTFTINSSLGSAITSLSVQSVVLDGGVNPAPTPTPDPSPDPVIKTGEFTLKIDATTLKASCAKQSCSAIIGVGTPSGQSALEQITFNPADTPVIERTYSNLLPGAYTLQVSNGTLPKGTTFDYGTGTGTINVAAGSKNNAAVNFKYTEPVINSNVNFSISGIATADSTKFAGVSSVEAEVTNEKTGQKYHISVPLSGNVSLNGIPTSDSYTIRTQSIANPQDGIFYKGIDVSGVKFSEGANNKALTFTKVDSGIHTLTFSVSGLEAGTNVPVTLADSGDINPGFYVYTAANVVNGSLLKFVDSTVAINVNSPSNYTLDDNYQKVANGSANISLKFTKQVAPQLTYNYDYFDPKTATSFKDYNYNINLTLNGDAKPKTIVMITNFQPSGLAGGTCFGQGIWGDSIKYVTQADGNVYKTTFTTTNSFDLKDRCLITGGNTGNSKTIIGTAVPYVSAVSADGVNVPIYQPCASNGCKDPGNGYVNAGYYANWAVWGRSYDPNKMPFDKINDVIYAFIGFDSATGKLRTLDDSPDYWGLTATTKAMLQYPYMHAHLSFGGWTNAGINTAPMFQKLSSNPAAMQTFATQAVELMRQTKFSGLDIDWEWWSDYKNNEAPAKQMLSFYKILRAELDNAGIKDGKHYTLTIAVNAGVDRVKAMQDTSVNPNAVADFWKQVNGLVDQVNLMTYDYHGAYDQDAAYFHANYDFANVPVEKQAAVGQTNGWSIKDVAAAYEANGITAKKLVVGLPIYARTMKVTSNTNGGLLQPITGAGFGDWEDGVLDYKCLLNPTVDPVNGCGKKEIPTDIVFYNSSATGNVLDSFNKYGRDALQPWGYSPSTGTFITFDDVWSVRAKTQKVIDQKLGGTMFWELDGDSTDANKSLVKAVSDKYLGK